jgi:hypothetical protein
LQVDGIGRQVKKRGIPFPFSQPSWLSAQVEVEVLKAEDIDFDPTLQRNSFR